MKTLMKNNETIGQETETAKQLVGWLYPGFRLHCLSASSFPWKPGDRFTSSNHPGLASSGTIIEWSPTEAVIRWDGCGWENVYDLTDPEQAIDLSEMTLEAE